MRLFFLQICLHDLVYMEEGYITQTRFFASAFSLISYKMVWLIVANRLWFCVGVGCNLELSAVTQMGATFAWVA